MATTNWHELIEFTMKRRGETLADLVDNTMTDEEMLKEFDDGYGSAEGAAFTAWSTRFVYFPVVYDGSEWVGSVPRHPNGEPTNHVGGQ
jgi:hypothetical protein